MKIYYKYFKAKKVEVYGSYVINSIQVMIVLSDVSPLLLKHFFILIIYLFRTAAPKVISISARAKTSKQNICYIHKTS